MPAETKKEVATPNLEDVAAQAIEKLKEENARLLAENDNLNAAKAKYYDKVLNGQESGKKEVTHRSAQEIREDLWGKGRKRRTDLENAILYNELDDAIIREEGTSVYLAPLRPGDSYSNEDIAIAKKAHEELDNLIKIANGDANVFRTEFVRRYPAPPIKAKTKK